MGKACRIGLSGAEWSCPEAQLPTTTPKPTGRPRLLHGLREILDATICILRNGCAQRLLHHTTAFPVEDRLPLPTNLEDRRYLGEA